MKSADFFIDKAKEYIISIDEVLKNPVSPYDGGFEPSPALKEFSEKTHNIKIKTKLLFSEFDNGELFLTLIKSADGNLEYLKHGENVLTSYKETLNLFIDHINEFRK